MNTSGTVQVISGTVILVAILAAIVALAWHGTITGTEAMGGIGAIITLGGGALAVHVGVNAGANAAGGSSTSSQRARSSS